MDARFVVESALRALIAHDVVAHARWIADDVIVESEPRRLLIGKAKYLDAIRTIEAIGARLLRYEVLASHAGNEASWTKVSLSFEGLRVPRTPQEGSIRRVPQQSEAWYAVRDGLIAYVRSRSIPQKLHLTTG